MTGAVWLVAVVLSATLYTSVQASDHQGSTTTQYSVSRDDWTSLPDMPDVCVRYFNCRINYTDAAYLCGQMDAQLVTARTVTESQALRGLIARPGKLKLWLGLTDQREESSSPDWRWVTGEQVVWSYWGTHARHSQGPRCAYVHLKSLRWEKCSCATLVGFACSRPRTPLTTPYSLMIDTTEAYTTEGHDSTTEVDTDGETLNGTEVNNDGETLDGAEMDTDTEGQDSTEGGIDGETLDGTEVDTDTEGSIEGEGNIDGSGQQSLS